MKMFARTLSLVLVALMLCTALVACAPAKDPADAVTALKEAEYLVINDDIAVPIAFKALGYDLKNVVTATKVSTNEDGNKVTDIVVIYYFADKDNAKKALEEVEKNAKEKKEETKESWVEPTRSGSIVYFGTKAAIKAAK
ncbi:MAG: hypothetical protein E7639_00785 [Ruminococcaceae bacterium]|nr:hypothetical protein [Oscillospiraceae bacterium]